MSLFSVLVLMLHSESLKRMLTIRVSFNECFLPSGRECSNSGCRGPFSLLLLGHRPWPLSQSGGVQTHSREAHRWVVSASAHSSFLPVIKKKPTVTELRILAGIAAPVDLEEEEIHDPNGETLILEARMQALLLDSMTKSKDGFLGVRKHPAPLAGFDPACSVKAATIC